MRSSIMLASALAATALAKPLLKRDVIVTQVDVVYQTDIVTVTAGQQPAASPAAAPSSSSHHHHHHHHSSSVAPAAASPSPSEAAAVQPSTTQAPAPANTPVESSPAAAAPTEASPGYGGTTTATNYQQAVINHHNYHRANHSAPAIAWSQDLANTAMNIAKTCVYAHNMSAGGSYGQNIAAGVGASDIATTISDLFYNGEVTKFNQYGQANPDMSNFEAWGHFSQIVWKDTTQVGCATWNCGSNLKNFGASNGYFTVCNYSPPGNWGGEYGENIGASKGMNTITGDFNVDQSEIGQSYCKATGQALN